MRFILGYDRWEQFRFSELDAEGNVVGLPSDPYAVKGDAMDAILTLDPAAEIIDRTGAGPVRPPS